jgi:hypothetical protein
MACGIPLSPGRDTANEPGIALDTDARSRAVSPRTAPRISQRLTPISLRSRSLIDESSAIARHSLCQAMQAARQRLNVRTTDRAADCAALPRISADTLKIASTMIISLAPSELSPCCDIANENEIGAEGRMP